MYLQAYRSISEFMVLIADSEINSDIEILNGGDIRRHLSSSFSHRQNQK